MSGCPFASGTGMGSGSSGASSGSHLCPFSTWGTYLSARQPHCHVFAKMKGPIIPPVYINRFDGQVGPSRKLRRDQPPHQRHIDSNHLELLISVSEHGNRALRLNSSGGPNDLVGDLMTQAGHAGMFIRR